MYVYSRIYPSSDRYWEKPKISISGTDELPALEENTSSPIIAQHLNAISAARKAYIEADLSSKLPKALRHPVRPYSDIIYRQNDTVYYKLPHENRWQGQPLSLDRTIKL